MSDYVTFVLDGCEYATRIDRVREVVRLAELTRLPGMAPPLAGILDLRGQSLPVLDIRPTSGAGGDVLVLCFGDTEVGFACDRVTAVLKAAQLPAEATGADPAASANGVLPAYVEQVMRGPHGAIFLVDLEVMAGAGALLPGALTTA